MINNPLNQKVDPLQQAILKLRAFGYSVEPSEFPPPPLPRLYMVSGPDVILSEFTENQVISFAAAR